MRVIERHGRIHVERTSAEGLSVQDALRLIRKLRDLVGEVESNNDEVNFEDYDDESLFAQRCEIITHRRLVDIDESLGDFYLLRSILPFHEICPRTYDIGNTHVFWSSHRGKWYAAAKGFEDKGFQKVNLDELLKKELGTDYETWRTMKAYGFDAQTLFVGLKKLGASIRFFGDQLIVAGIIATRRQDGSWQVAAVAADSSLLLTFVERALTKKSEFETCFDGTVVEERAKEALVMDPCSGNQHFVGQIRWLVDRLGQDAFSITDKGTFLWAHHDYVKGHFAKLYEAQEGSACCVDKAGYSVAKLWVYFKTGELPNPWDGSQYYHPKTLASFDSVLRYYNAVLSAYYGRLNPIIELQKELGASSV